MYVAIDVASYVVDAYLPPSSDRNCEYARSTAYVCLFPGTAPPWNTFRSPIRTVTSDMPGVTTNATNDSSRCYALPGATNDVAATFIVAESPIQDGEVAKLVALPLIATLRCSHGRINDTLNELLSPVDFTLSDRGNQAMERALLVVSVGVSNGALRTAESAFFNRALAANGDGGAGASIHVGDAASSKT